MFTERGGGGWGIVCLIYGSLKWKKFRCNGENKIKILLLYYWNVVVGGNFLLNLLFSKIHRNIFQSMSTSGIDNLFTKLIS